MKENPIFYGTNVKELIVLQPQIKILPSLFHILAWSSFQHAVRKFVLNSFGNETLVWLFVGSHSPTLISNLFYQVQLLRPNSNSYFPNPFMLTANNILSPCFFGSTLIARGRPPSIVF